ncbi:MAG: biotin transporter BioY [Rhizobiales bacterium 32-66-8]|nr:MAG: biotin transporter BioY [Rhizobiales bacterium 32-66-8]
MVARTPLPPGSALLAIALGLAALIAASYASVPMYPVPMTLQTLAVLLVGALAGPRLGAAIVLVWLALALMGAPVLSGGKAGLAALTGGTAGFLLSFPLAAYLAGLLPAWRGAGGFAWLMAAFLLLHGLILLAGWGRLSLMIGAEAAFTAGVGPFLPGAAVKSALAALILILLRTRTGIAAPGREA